MRCFIGIPLPPDLWPALLDVQKRLSGDIKRVEPENLHINLKFLGEVRDATIPSIEAAMDQVAGSTKPFTISVSGVGGFPNPHHPRVVWAGAQGDFSVQAVLDTQLARLGFTSESREFTPHITLARVRSGSVSLPDAGVLGSFEAARMCLMKSDLAVSGPVYSVVHASLFKPA